MAGTFRREHRAVEFTVSVAPRRKSRKYKHRKRPTHRAESDSRPNSFKGNLCLFVSLSRFAAYPGQGQRLQARRRRRQLAESCPEVKQFRLHQTGRHKRKPFPGAGAAN